MILSLVRSSALSLDGIFRHQLIGRSVRTFHTPVSITFSTPLMKIVQVPVLEDNYAYLLIDEQQQIAAAVDPVTPDALIDAAKTHGVSITSILTTHHHWDHADGNPGMIKKLGNIPVYGGDDRIPKLSKKVTEGDTIEFGGMTIKVLFTPCHTTGHVLYFVEDKNKQHDPALFSGDTLFVGGCGRFFEGTGEQMYAALVEKAANLPDNTQVHCGHEYSVANLKFARHVDPDNEVLKAKYEWAMQRRTNKPPQTTVPSTIKEEKDYNPFMRVNEAAIRKAVSLTDAATGSEVMTKLRELKNSFKG